MAQLHQVHDHVRGDVGGPCSIANTAAPTTLVRERARVVNRIQKTLEGANVKLGDVASDVLGMSGRAMLEAIVARCGGDVISQQLA